MFKHTPLPLYFFLAAFTGFAFVLVLLTIPNIKYVLLIYKFTELDWSYPDGESSMAPDLVPNTSCLSVLRGIYNTGLYYIEMRSGHLESKKHKQEEDNEFSDPYCEDSEYIVP